MGKYAPVIKTAECGSMTRAAHVLGYTQPSLGYIINNIENDLGVKLFYRDQRGVTLTETGSDLLKLMRKIEAMEDELQEAARVSQWELLRVGIFAGVSAQWMPEILEVFSKTYPKVVVKLETEKNPLAGELALREHRLNCCFHGTKCPPGMELIPLYKDPYYLVVSKHSPLALRGKTAVLDLALYPDAGSEKLFLQDLYAALHAPGEILIFEHYESCYPGFLKTIADLATKGSAPLSSRYLVNKEGILVDAGTALAPGAVSRIDPCGKYLIFFSHKGREVLADKFGAPFVSAVGDVCTTTAFAREDLAAMAAQELNALAQKVRTRLGLTLTAGADVRDYVAAQCSKEKGAAGLKLCCDRIFRALSEYCLQTDTALTGTVALTAVPEGLQFALNGAAPADLFSLLPTEYTGAVDKIRAELDALVGLAPVKDYVFGLADNLQVQQRRAAAGFKTASLSMHMIFTGNPGTGKTTIARLVAKYLKAIGALKGGQLVEVSRGDLVGRYTGHTAPLTNSVIQSALGGVLFIDEAYSLYRGEQDSFGLEAIDTLVKGMEDHRDELVVILAGYTKEMEGFLTANSGLASRFPNKVEFPDYTADELLDITTVLAKGKGYRLDESCTFPLLGYYKRRQALDSRTAGNGRLARNTLEKAIFNQSRRLIAEPAAPLDLIQPSDLEFEE